MTRPSLPLLLTAALAGFACMSAELTAVRLLAPHFGDSAYVWTNVIGVILGALAVGAVYGGRRAAGVAPLRHAGTLLVVAGAWLCFVPCLVGWLGPVLLPQELPLDAAMPALVRGSLAATTIAFALPMLVLGAVSPLLVAGAVQHGAAVGRAAGNLGAAGTVGSLLGTFLATHWLVPGFGCRVAMGCAGLVLVCAGLVVRRSVATVAASAMAMASLLLHQGPLRAASPPRTLLAEVESPVQFLQVVRDDSVPERPRTLLVLNEGLDSFHSMQVHGSSLTDGAYYDWHALAPLLAGDGVVPEGLRVLSIGDAAGTLRTVYAAIHPGATVDAVDVDAAAMDLGDRFFAADKAAGQRFVVDGRVFLQHAARRWHVIHVDAYAHQVYVPAHLASREFFELAHARLEQGGVLACNVGALRPDDPVLTAIAGTMREQFGSVLALPVPNSRNVLLVGRRDTALSPERLAAAHATPTTLQPEDAARWRAMLAHATHPAKWWSISGERVLVDDRPELDELLMAGYLADGDPGTATVCSGTSAPSAAELDAYEARLLLDWQAVLRHCAASATATTFLRELAGDARWALRHLRAAELEYEAALASGPDASARLRLERNLGFVREDLQRIEAARACGARNGWLLAASLLLVGLLGAAWLRSAGGPAAA